MAEDTDNTQKFTSFKNEIERMKNGLHLFTPNYFRKCPESCCNDALFLFNILRIYINNSN